MLVKSTYTYLSFMLAVFTLAVALQFGSAKHLAAAELPNFVDLVERNAPSIVEISTIRRMAVRPPVATEPVGAPPIVPLHGRYVAVAWSFHGRSVVLHGRCGRASVGAAPIGRRSSRLHCRWG